MGVTVGGIRVEVWIGVAIGSGVDVGEDIGAEVGVGCDGALGPTVGAAGLVDVGVDNSLTQDIAIRLRIKRNSASSLER